jgi:hypothetical protein
VDTYGLMRGHMMGRTVNRSLKIYIGISLGGAWDGCEIVEDTLTALIVMRARLYCVSKRYGGT